MRKYLVASALAVAAPMGGGGLAPFHTSGHPNGERVRPVARVAPLLAPDPELRPTGPVARAASGSEIPQIDAAGNSYTEPHGSVGFFYVESPVTSASWQVKGYPRVRMHQLHKVPVGIAREPGSLWWGVSTLERLHEHWHVRHLTLTFRAYDHAAYAVVQEVVRCTGFICVGGPPMLIASHK